MTYSSANILYDLGTHGKFDYIRCANVLWHYGDAKTRVILFNLEKLRSEGGVLAVGSSNGMEEEIIMLKKGDRISDFF
ncbi:MAG: hypothetical protein NTV88_04020 [Candidatus Micrarchaeota archaeon]|nr:hypothetical protein [Candidatus Micrarchaeota archaeon]